MATALVAVLALPALVLVGTAGAQPSLTTSLVVPRSASVPTLTPRSTPSTVPADTTTVRIAMTENNDNNVVVYSPGGVSAPGVADSPAVLFVEQTVAAGTWKVYAGPTCGGGAAGATWHPVTTGQVKPVASPVTVSEPLQLCVVSGNTTVDGTLTALYNSTGDRRTVNTLPLETYVADTVPAESPSTWSTLGGPGPGGQNWGFQELEAQAVAVRSYVLADLGGYGGYADTCDLTCQTYRGTAYVSPASIAAANDTAGQVMFMPNGSIATTEYSASTGGYTASATEESPFTPVPDTGDGVTGNSHHDWSATVTNHWPQVGTMTSITVTHRNGLGTWGGRAVTVVVHGTGGSVTLTAAQFVAATSGTGVQSNWFSNPVVSGGAATLQGHGWGHGIGMGQWGALGYAIGQDNGQGNWTYQQIVGHYYGPATLGNLSGPPAPVEASGGIGGYWLSAADGGIFSFGSAQFHGSMGGQPLNAPVSGMAPTADHGGYWEVAADGGIFSFGDAQFHGSMGGRPLNQPIVGMAATPDGGGYWLVAADGGIFAFGDARFDGSTGSLRLDAPVVGMAATPDGGGYWLVAADGGIFTFGDATFVGSAAGTAGGPGATAVVPTSTGKGYLVVTSEGRVTAFGDGPQLGDLTTAVPNYRGVVVGAAADPD
ncbi:MAG TPA: SpoIID/LytB domain-containing protein [Acidimicrobiales bacterium]|nr:SpoIID/LytB domain-containing protein [Acidimicrobiales bacterium]